MRRRRARRVLRNWSILLIILAVVIVAVVIILMKKNNDQSGNSETQTQEQMSDTDIQDTETTVNELAENDTTAPEIRGEGKIFVAKGANVKYKSYVYVTDDLDPDPKLTIDNSNVDLSKEGTYKVIYTATDWAGNTTTREVEIEVGAEEEPNVSEDVIYAKADEVLAEIIEDDMTDLEKVFAVFFYVRDTFTYVKDNNYWEYKQEAYHMMMTLHDNCYANVCVSKLLLERLGFESFMITGTLGYLDEYHYWNMVSIDGGKSWYHYDSAWWTWMNDEYPICMVTDEMAKKISDAHGGIFIYNEEDYPKTPTEALWTPQEMGYTSAYID